MQSPSGLILVDKPAGISSFGVVGKIRWLLSQKAGKKVKVGHTGTLDPFATGLMILVVGDYCKRAGEFSKLGKTYEATLRLGQISTTGDPEGEVSDVSNKKPTQAEIEAVLAKFTGEITQTPPAFSAIKINGQRAYKLARAGQEVEMPIRRVSVHSLELLGYDYPHLQIRTSVSSGTYIRSLAQDIGEELGTGAYVTELRRTEIDRFTLEKATTIDTLTPDEAGQRILTL